MAHHAEHHRHLVHRRTRTMAKIMLVALGAVLAACGFAAAAEPVKSGFSGGAGGLTMTLGGQGTAAEAATSTEDTEEACCCWRKHCGYYGGYGYGGYGYGGGGY